MEHRRGHFCLFLRFTINAHDVAEMAGNIIPAVASTNAIIAGLVTLNAIKILSGHFSDCKSVYLSHSNPTKLLHSENLQPPNESCTSCSMEFMSIQCDAHFTTVEHFVDFVRKRCKLSNFSIVRDDSYVTRDHIPK